jgi:hypothetical protein
VRQGQGLPVVVTFGLQQGSRTQAWCYDFVSVAVVLLHSHMPASGSVIINIHGSEYGIQSYSSSIFVQSSHFFFSGSVNGSVCEFSFWHSISSISSKINSGFGGRGGFGLNHGFSIVVSSGIQRGSRTQSFAYNSSFLSFFSRQNLPSTGGRSVLCKGTNSGRSSSSVTINVGASPCQSTTWLSDSLINCKISSGLGGFHSASVSFLRQVSTIAAAFSFDVLAAPSLPPLAVSNLTLVKKGYPNSIFMKWNLDVLLVQSNHITEIAVMIFPFKRIMKSVELNGNNALIDHTSYDAECFDRIPPTSISFHAPGSLRCTKPLEPGTIQYVVVFTINSVGKSAISMLVQVTKLPEAPRNFKFLIIGSFKVSVSWEPTDLGFSDFIEYAIEYSLANDSSTGLSKETTKTFSVSQRFTVFSSTFAEGRFLTFSVKTCTAVGCSYLNENMSFELITYPPWVDNLTSIFTSAGMNFSFETSNVNSSKTSFFLLLSTSQYFMPSTSYSLDIFRPEFTSMYEGTKTAIFFSVSSAFIKSGFKYFLDIESCNPVGCTNAKSFGTLTATHIVDLSPNFLIKTVAPSELEVGSGTAVTVTGFLRNNATASATLSNGVKVIACPAKAHFIQNQVVQLIVNVSQWRDFGETQLILRVDDEISSALIQFANPRILVLSDVSMRRGTMEGGQRIDIQISNVMESFESDEVRVMFGSELGKLVGMQNTGFGMRTLAVLTPAVQFTNDTIIDVKIHIKKKEYLDRKSGV